MWRLTWFARSCWWPEQAYNVLPRLSFVQDGPEEMAKDAKKYGMWHVHLWYATVADMVLDYLAQLSH